MLVVSFTGLGASLIGNHGNNSAGAVKDPPVATVNGAPILQSQYENGLAALRQRNQMMQQPESVMTAFQDHARVLNGLIDNTLTLQIAEQQGITATPADIDAARQQQLVKLRQELSLPASATDDQINRSLQDHNITETVDQMYPDAQLKPAVITQKYTVQLIRNTKVSDQDVRAFYHQVHVRHILISNTKHTDAQALALANHVLDKLKAGGDFASLATQYSEDPSVKVNKGDDNWIDQSTQYVPEFKKAALSLSPGQTTPTPIKSDQYGYFIIQCLAARDNLPKDFDKNKQQYAAQVTQSEVSDQQQAALNAALSKAKIVVNDPQLRADRELLLAQNDDSGNLTKRNADLTAALADYQQALGKTRFSAQGEIHAAMANIYFVQNQTDNEIAQLADAVQNSGEPQLNFILGSLYRKKGDTKDALAQFKLASDTAYDSLPIHEQLAMVYKQMKETGLAAKEDQWVANYQARQKQAMASMAPTASTTPGVTIVPGAGGKITLKAPDKKK
jgi:parvulin-like peptidyl-prolyl isomerase